MYIPENQLVGKGDKVNKKRIPVIVGIAFALISVLVYVYRDSLRPREVILVAEFPVELSNALDVAENHDLPTYSELRKTSAIPAIAEDFGNPEEFSDLFKDVKCGSGETLFTFGAMWGCDILLYGANNAVVYYMLFNEDNIKLDPEWPVFAHAMGSDYDQKGDIIQAGNSITINLEIDVAERNTTLVFMVIVNVVFFYFVGWFVLALKFDPEALKD